MKKNLVSFLAVSISFYSFINVCRLTLSRNCFQNVVSFGFFDVFDTAVEASESVSAGAETSSCRITLSSQQPLPSYIGSSCCTRESGATVSSWQASVSIQPDLCRACIGT